MVRAEAGRLEAPQLPFGKPCLLAVMFLSKVEGMILDETKEREPKAWVEFRGFAIFILCRLE